MDLNISIIDAFTDEIFKGNPAAVIITNEWLCDKLMQSIATENNLSETAFVKKINHERYHIRWFSPITEIDFCGHATLASAFVIFKKNRALSTISFFAKSVGDVSVVKQSNDYFQMSFPNRKPKVINEIPPALLNGVSITPTEVLLNNQAYFVVYDSETKVREVKTNSELLKQLAPYDVVVTAPSLSDKFDFVSRYFWPANGGDEDPVTGSIHAGLAPFWHDRLNKHQLSAYQASARGGKLLCQVDENQVYVSGQAVQFLEGKINVHKLT